MIDLLLVVGIIGLFVLAISAMFKGAQKLVNKREKLKKERQHEEMEAFKHAIMATQERQLKKLVNSNKKPASLKNKFNVSKKEKKKRHSETNASIATNTMMVDSFIPDMSYSSHDSYSDSSSHGSSYDGGGHSGGDFSGGGGECGGGGSSGDF